MNELQRMIESLRTLGLPDLGARIAAKAAANLRATLTASLSAGTSPDGERWAPKKAPLYGPIVSGGRAYANAASKLAVTSIGNLVKATVTGGEAYGQFGVRGAPVRQMLPDAGADIPTPVEAAMVKAASDLFDEVTR